MLGRFLQINQFPINQEECIFFSKSMVNPKTVINRNKDRKQRKTMVEIKNVIW